MWLFGPSRVIDEVESRPKLRGGIDADSKSRHARHACGGCLLWRINNLRRFFALQVLDIPGVAFRVYSDSKRRLRKVCTK